MSSDSDDNTFNPSQGLRKPSLQHNNQGCGESVASTNFSNFSSYRSKLSLSQKKKEATQTYKEFGRPKSQTYLLDHHDAFDIVNHAPQLSRTPSPLLIEGDDLCQEIQTGNDTQPLNFSNSNDKAFQTTLQASFDMSVSSTSSEIPVSQKHAMPRSSHTSPTENEETDLFLLGADTEEDETEPPPKKIRTSRSPSLMSSATTIPAVPEITEHPEIPENSHNPKIIVRKSERESSQLTQESVRRCSVCFIPANVIGGALEVHSQTCRQKPLAVPPCRDGPNCKSLSKAHYNAYRHESDVHQSSESSILTLSLASDRPGEITQAFPVLEEPPADLEATVPLHAQNVSPSKIAYIQKWLNSHEVVDDESDRQSLGSLKSGKAPKPSPPSCSVVTLECQTGELRTNCMATPVKNNNRPVGENSSGSKQTSITEFFTPTRSPPIPEVRTPNFTAPVFEMTKIRTSTIIELCGSHVPVPTAPLAPPPTPAVPAAPAVPAVVNPPASDTRTQWSVLMSRMRGTAANVEREITGSAPKAAEMGKCPFYKRIPNTGFAVDAFSYGPIPGVTSYFLSHFHYDHYRGLGKWLNKPMYCSQITANLVRLKMRAVGAMVRVLPLNESRLIDNVEVVLIDANHCPGSVMFLFRFPTGQTMLHTGDFRADKSMHTNTFLSSRPIDQLFLDTTYCNEYYKLPAQSEVIEYVRRLVRQYANKCPKLLVVVGTYTVGKEKVFITAADELNCLIWAPTEKRSVLKCLEDSVLNRRLVSDPYQCQVHVVNTSDIKAANLTSYYQQFKSSFTHILALHPTGWEHDDSVASQGLDAIKPKSYGNVFIYGVPYSEHSSYEELKSFVCHFKPSKIVPHVGVGSAATRQRMESIFAEWRNNGNWWPKNSQKTQNDQSSRGKSLRPRGGQRKRF